jgi:hypothetical protein
MTIKAKPGLGKGGTATITVDGAAAGTGTFPHTIPIRARNQGNL